MIIAFALDRLIDRRKRPGLNEKCEVAKASVPDGEWIAEAFFV